MEPVTGAMTHTNQGHSRRDERVEDLFAAHYDALRRLAFVILADRGAAEEVVMDAFAKSLGRWNLFRDLDRPELYLRKSVVNGCRSKLRRWRLETRVNRTAAAGAETHRDIAGERDLRLDVLVALRSLPPTQRFCIALRYLEDLPEQEIADVLQLPLGTVKSQLARARTKLRAAMSWEEEGPR